MKKSELFEVLEPPPFGWSRLSARLTERRQRRWQLALGLAFALAIVVLGTITSERSAPIELFPGVRDSIGLGFVVPAGAEPVSLRGGTAALLRLPSSNPQVVMYRLAALDADQPRAGE